MDGVHCPLEMHLVHVSENFDLVMVAVLFKCGQDANPFLAQFTDKLPSKAIGKESEVKLTAVDAEALELSKQPYFSYTGSLTTPPCSEVRPSSTNSCSRL